jgi:hypothetical protein
MLTVTVPSRGIPSARTHSFSESLHSLPLRKIARPKGRPMAMGSVLAIQPFPKAFTSPFLHSTLRPPANCILECAMMGPRLSGSPDQIGICEL